jgi:hypothetical protein
LRTRAAGAVALPRADLTPPPEMANRVYDPVNEIVPTVAVMSAFRDGGERHHELFPLGVQMAADVVDG